VRSVHIIAALGGALVLLIVGIIVYTTQATTPSPSGEVQVHRVEASQLALDLPPAALPTPAALRFLRLRDQRAGALETTEGERLLFGVGLGRCQDGWAVQGYYINAQGKPVTSEPILLGLAPALNTPIELPQPVVYPEGPADSAPAPLPRNASVTLSALSYEHIKGTITLKVGDAQAWRMTLDARPTGLAPDAALVGRACHMTGYFTIGDQAPGSPQSAGPVIGQPSGPDLYYMHIPLAQDEELVVMIGHKTASQTVPLEVRDAPARIADVHDEPVRVYLAQRDPTTEDGWEPTPLAGGKVSLAWPGHAPQGPVELTIDGMLIPEDWTGALAGHTAPLTVRALVMFPRDIDGARVPVPPTPPWWGGALER
jgi:hypothetical protein